MVINSKLISDIVEACDAFHQRVASKNKLTTEDGAFTKTASKFKPGIGGGRPSTQKKRVSTKIKAEAVKGARKIVTKGLPDDLAAKVGLKFDIAQNKHFGDEGASPRVKRNLLEDKKILHELNLRFAILFANRWKRYPLTTWAGKSLVGDSQPTIAGKKPKKSIGDAKLLKYQDAIQKYGDRSQWAEQAFLDASRGIPRLSKPESDSIAKQLGIDLSDPKVYDKKPELKPRPVPTKPEKPTSKSSKYENWQYEAMFTVDLAGTIANICKQAFKEPYRQQLFFLYLLDGFFGFRTSELKEYKDKLLQASRYDQDTIQRIKDIGLSPATEKTVLERAKLYKSKKEVANVVKEKFYEQVYEGEEAHGAARAGSTTEDLIDEFIPGMTAKEWMSTIRKHVSFELSNYRKQALVRSEKVQSLPSVSAHKGFGLTETGPETIQVPGYEDSDHGTLKYKTDPVSGYRFQGTSQALPTRVPREHGISGQYPVKELHRGPGVKKKDVSHLLSHLPENRELDWPSVIPTGGIAPSHLPLHHEAKALALKAGGLIQQLNAAHAEWQLKGLPDISKRLGTIPRGGKRLPMQKKRKVFDRAPKVKPDSSKTVLDHLTTATTIMHQISSELSKVKGNGKK